ncbi:chemotaxis protein CheA [Helicobacter monodelphidis]|uniref:hybrid sensor histidine kinase/response regulator n=1 Tax=Helicobacter sp. 15-1451 TaxID=2004995 RepID=UPI000DCDB262|nr:chemotaxis protein CheW [Helicobacter sp. 15-1451]RAX57277.1 chemotaxis protein CheA [Helicobacter sp. 15-1451]
MDELQEILEDFLIEAFEMIEQLDQDLVELESNPEDLELLNRIFRVAHTVKGSSSFLNFDVLTHLTHHMEDVLNKARHGDLKLTPDVMDVVLESIDLMKSLLNAIRDSGSDANTGLAIEDVVQRLDAISNGRAAPAAEAAPAPVEAPPPPVEEEPEPDYANMSPEEVEAEIERLLKKRQEEDRARREAKKASGGDTSVQAPVESAPATPPPAPATPPPPKPAPKAAEAPKAAAGGGAAPKAPAAAVEQTIRVDVKRLDHLMSLIGELVLGKNRLIKIYDDVEERYEGEKFLEELNQVVSSVSTVTTDLQLAVMKTRMIPVGKVFNKFPRMVRDLSRELGKNIELEISGEETELDKSIVEEIGDPLVHIIRNSCDHGVEMPQDRAKVGKPEAGTIKLKAYNEGNHIVIEVADDGKGLNADALKQKGIEKGVISEREADSMTDKEAFGIIFKAGFSTAKQVSNLSGRGVGMDVVKTNIEKLNGIIDVDSEWGKGMVLKLKIPLTLAIIQALLVGVQEEYYAIPLASVLETVRVGQDEIYSVEGKSVLRLRNEVLSLVRLGDIFGVDSVFQNTEEAYVVVIGLAENKIGVIVDFLVGQEEIVIKSLGYYLSGTDGIAGATVRGDGKVTLIVDVAAMMQMAKHIKVNVSQKGESESQSVKQKTSPSDYVILAVDDSKVDRAIIQKSLKPLGITVVEAVDGLQALEIVKNGDKQFDAILIDIEMPKMDGYTLATEIRKYNKFKNLPLIAVTSRTSKTDRMRGVEAGMTEYITKPYSPEYLMNVVKRNINLDVEVESV